MNDCVSDLQASNSKVEHFTFPPVIIESIKRVVGYVELCQLFQAHHTGELSSIEKVVTQADFFQIGIPLQHHLFHMVVHQIAIFELQYFEVQVNTILRPASGH